MEWQGKWDFPDSLPRQGQILFADVQADEVTPGSSADHAHRPAATEGIENYAGPGVCSAGAGGLPADGGAVDDRPAPNVESLAASLQARAILARRKIAGPS